jgi:hypothetical protein
MREQLYIYIYILNFHLEGAKNVCMVLNFHFFL